MKIKKKISRILGVVLTLALLSSLALVAAPVMALTQPTATIASGDNIISKADAEYTVIFTLGQDLEVGDKITLTFPSDTAIAAPSATIQGSPGWIGGTWGPAVTTSVAWSFSATSRTIIATLGAGDKIGQGATVRIEITAGITNPSSPGDYTLTVKTTDEPTAVTSTAYTLKAPTVDPLPGIVLVLNASGIPMANFTGDDAIENAIIEAGEDFTIEIGPGTYYAADDSFDTAADGVTFVGTGGAAVTVIKIDVIIDNTDITLDGLTIQGEMDISADDVLIQNCVFEKLSSGAQMLVLWDTTNSGTIKDSSFDTTKGSADDIAIAIGNDGLTISGNSFAVDEDDIAVGAMGNTTIKDNTFTGSSGVGVGVIWSNTTIKDNTFDGLANAIAVYDCDVLITGNTIKNSTGEASAPPLWWGPDPTGGAIWAYDADATITDNDIMDSEKYVLVVDSGGDDVYMLYNNITGNAKSVDNNAGGEVDASHNWWGDAAGPASAASGDVIIDGVLGGPVELGTAVVGVDWVTSLNAKTKVGLTLSADDDANVLGAAVYDGNPFTATPYPALGDVVDVYVSEDNSLGSGDEVLIKLYADVDDLTMALAWSELAGEWIAPDNQGVSTFGGYVWVIADADTIPSIADLAGIPMVLVTGPEPPPPPLVLMAPDPRATDSAITNVAFAWYSATGADSYELRISGNANLSSPIVLETLPGTAYTYTGSLVYSTPYYWQVTALDGTTVLSVSEIATFTTKAEPEPPAPTPTITVEIPEITIPPLEQPVVTVVLPDAPTPTITTVTPVIEVPPTPAYVWAIVGIGAVLMIAVIVLIVRTRRIV